MTTTEYPLIGAHVSISGGINNAPSRAKAENCETFQCFTRSPQGGKAPELTDGLVADFKSEMAKAGMSRFYIHAPYYINLASLAGNIRYGSINVLREELERGSLLGAPYLMAHPGSFSGQSQNEGIARAGEALVKMLDGYTGTCRFLIEISAGTGNVLGDTFDEVAAMMAQVKEHPGFGGVCFDTCHAFASGYDFRTSGTAEKTLDEFDRTVGLEWLKLTHVNDSMVDLGNRRDRHQHLGKGTIGLAGFRELLGTAAFARIDWILETETDGRLQDVVRVVRPKALGQDVMNTCRLEDSTGGTAGDIIKSYLILKETEKKKEITADDAKHGQERVQKITDDFILHRETIDKLVASVKELKTRNPKLGVGEFKDLTGVSRKYAIPLLEYLDRERVTRRVGDAREIL